jgi:hypothetical protein
MDIDYPRLCRVDARYPLHYMVGEFMRVFEKYLVVENYMDIYEIYISAFSGF